uniref:Internalin-I n=1 Tax=Anthurium amnicola TaxID=1678845 RepID=A0A1D1Y438_9ARAE
MAEQVTLEGGDRCPRSGAMMGSPSSRMEEVGGGLVGRCMEAAAGSAASVEKWRRQRRTLERLPTHLADALFHLLRRRRLLYPSLLEVFQHCVEEVDLHGDNYVDAEWMAYLGAFRSLRVLNLAGCRAISNSALWSITGMTTLKELDLSRCSRITDAGLEHILSISNLEKIRISETRLTSEGIMRLSSLVNLRVLDLGGLPVTDQAMKSLQVLTQLEYLDLWGSDISDKGAAMLNMFPKLNYLNIGWTNVNKLPNLPAIVCLDLSNCTVHSMLEKSNTAKAPLSKLFLHRTTFIDVDEAFSYLKESYLSVLDLSRSPICHFNFLAKLKSLKQLDLSSSQMTDNLIDAVASVGFNLRDLNLSNTKVTSQAMCLLAGNVPNLERLSLSQTSIDDTSLQYLSMMPSLKIIDLSKTSIKGFAYLEGSKLDKTLSLAMLQSLDHLENLNLEETLVRDEVLHPLGMLRGLKCLYLKSDFLSDVSFHTMSSLPNLTFLGFQGAVLSNQGLHLFSASAKLHVLDLRGCWLLNKDCISSFCEKFPQIEVKHALAPMLPVEQNIQFGPSLLHRTTQMPTSKLRMSGQSQFKFSKDQFADERIKYSRGELLELQFSHMPDVLANLRDLLPKALMD